MEQKDIHDIWDIAVFLQMMAAFCDDLDFNEYMPLMQDLHKLIKVGDKDFIEQEIPFYEKKLNNILKRIKPIYPPKRSFSDIATDWNNMFVENEEFLSYGVSIGWLEERVDLTNYYRYDYAPYQFKVGLVVHKGRGEIEENFILQDSFTSLVKAKRLLKKLEIEGATFKKEAKSKGEYKLDFLESLNQSPMTIFTTAYSEYAVDAFRLQAIDYLLKPIDFKRFFQATQKAKEIYYTQLLLKTNNETSKNEVYIRQGDCFQKIDWREILFVEGLQNYLKLHFKKTTLIIHQTMTSLEDMLPKENFFRIHRSFLINLSHIQKIRGNMVYIDGTIIPIAKPRKEDLLKSVVYNKLISK